jgi:hypothetical protein
MKLRVGKYDLSNVLTSPPKLTDQLESICRTLDFSIYSPEPLPKLYGSPVELYYNDKRWFFGFLFVQDVEDSGQVSFKAYDPLYYFKKTPNDYYFKGMTASQGLNYLAEQVGVVVANIGDTGAVLGNLYYSNKTPDKIAVDLIARSYQKNNRKFWFRFNPDVNSFGLEVFERVMPEKAWAFQYGVNLTKGKSKGSIEETTPVVRFISRETGKEVLLVDDEALKTYGHMVTLKEVNKDDVDDMDADAKTLFDKVSKPKEEQSIEGINPEAKMPMFFAGDVVYAEEKHTALIGGYYIKNVVHTFHSDKVISLTMDLQLRPDIPQVLYEDQKNDEKKIGQSTPEAVDNSGGGVSSNGQYNEQVQALIEKYGLKKNN